jgi:hypothetical protein
VGSVESGPADSERIEGQPDCASGIGRLAVLGVVLSTVSRITRDKLGDRQLARTGSSAIWKGGTGAWTGQTIRHLAMTMRRQSETGIRICSGFESEVLRSRRYDRHRSSR